MCDHSENFRNDLAMKLASMLPADKINEVLGAVDLASSGYNIERKPMELSVISDIPEVVKWFIGSKAVENLSGNTLMHYRYRLYNFFRTVRKPFVDITANDIRVYLFYCKQNNGNSDTTIDNIRRILNSFFGWLVTNEYLQHNPVAKIPHIKFQEKERAPLSSYDLELLRWNCVDVKEKALVDFLFSTGCRVSECVDVKLGDISWPSRSVIIRHGKGDKRRTVYFNAESEVSLRKYLDGRNDSCEYLFVTERGPSRKMSPRSVQVIIKKITLRSGIEARCTPHVLRHTFATVGIRNGVPLEKLQALMGHSKPETTLIYAKLDHGDLQTAHEHAY